MDHDQESSDLSDDTKKQKKKKKDAYFTAYQNTTFPKDGYIELCESCSTSPPVLPGHVWKEFFIEDYHKVAYKDITDSLVKKSEVVVEPGLVTAINTAVVKLMSEKLRPVYVSRNQLQSAGSSDDTFFLEFKKVADRLYLRFRCPHSFRKKKAKTFTTGVVNLSADGTRCTSIHAARRDCTIGKVVGKCWHVASMFTILSENLLLDVQAEASTSGENKWKRLRRAAEVKLSIRRPVEEVIRQVKQREKTPDKMLNTFTEEELKKIRAQFLAHLPAGCCLRLNREDEQAGDSKPWAFTRAELASGANIKDPMFQKLKS